MVERARKSTSAGRTGARRGSTSRAGRRVASAHSGDARSGAGPTRAARVVERKALARRASRGRAQGVAIPVLANGADPGRTMPSPMAICDRLVIDRRLVEDYGPDRLFAYDVSTRDMDFLRGFAAPGDRIVFRRGGHITPDRICAVRTRAGIVLARVEFRGQSLVLLPGQGKRAKEPLELENVQGLPGVVAGTHVLLIRR